MAVNGVRNWWAAVEINSFLVLKMFNSRVRSEIIFTKPEIPPFESLILLVATLISIFGSSKEISTTCG